MIHTSHNIVVFSDGSSRGNPGPGGFGAIVVKHDDSRIHADRTQINADNSGIHVVELGGRAEHTTNNRMELQAAIKALEFLKGLTSNRERGQTLKKHSRAAAYSYVSMVGGVTQTHRTWAECEKRVKGKPARYKKAFSAEEEKKIIVEWEK